MVYKMKRKKRGSEAGPLRDAIRHAVGEQRRLRRIAVRGGRFAKLFRMFD